MKLKYEIDLDDCIAFSDQLMKTSPLMRKAIRKGQLWWASGPLVGALMVSMVKGASPEEALATLSVLSVAISLPMFLLYPHYFKYNNKKQINKLHGNNKYKGVVGVHEMTISNDFLADKTEYDDSKIEWDSISKIESSSEYTYIFTSEVTAYIISHKKIIDGDITSFVAKLNEVFKVSSR